MFLLFVPKYKELGLQMDAETRREFRHVEAFHSLTTVLGLRKWNALGQYSMSFCRKQIGEMCLPYLYL